MFRPNSSKLTSADFRAHISIFFLLSGQVISSSQRHLPDNTENSQQTDVHASRWDSNYDLSRLMGADLCLRPCGHWDRQFIKRDEFIEVYALITDGRRKDKISEFWSGNFRTELCDFCKFSGAAGVSRGTNL